MNKVVVMLREEPKRTYNVRTIFYVLVVTMLAGCSSGTATTETDETPVVLDSALMMPDFTMFTIEDSAMVNSSSIPKDGLILLKYFSPDCNHCQDDADLYVSKKDSLQNIRTIWVTGNWAPLDSVRTFVSRYQLYQIDPVAVGKETTNFLLANYRIQRIPYNVLFKDNQVIREYTKIDFQELIAINNGNYVPETAAVD